jgi:hypothetical protein
MFTSHWPLCMALALLPGSAQVAAQISVVPATGITPRFPKADAELAKQAKPPSRRWLMDANDDIERMRRLELWGGAGDLEMQEIAHRLEELHSAIQKENWDLGIYHLEKMRGRMLVAAIKRPTRTQNLEDMFLDSGIYTSMQNALTSKNAELARVMFEDTRLACMACHTAEKLAFINDSSVFKRVASFPPFKP